MATQKHLLAWLEIHFTRHHICSILSSLSYSWIPMSLSIHILKATVSTFIHPISLHLCLFIPAIWDKTKIISSHHSYMILINLVRLSIPSYSCSYTSLIMSASDNQNVHCTIDFKLLTHFCCILLKLPHWQEFPTFCIYYFTEKLWPPSSGIRTTYFKYIFLRPFQVIQVLTSNSS